MTPPVALVLRSVLVTPDIARRVVVAFVVVELPCTTRSPEIVDDEMRRPLENVRVVFVALPGKRYEKVGSPSDEVAVSA